MSLSYIVDAPRTPLSLSMKAFEFAEMVEEAQGCGQEGHSIGNLVNDACQRLGAVWSCWLRVYSALVFGRLTIIIPLHTTKRLLQRTVLFPMSMNIDQIRT